MYFDHNTVLMRIGSDLAHQWNLGNVSTVSKRLSSGGGATYIHIAIVLGHDPYAIIKPASWGLQQQKGVENLTPMRLVFLYPA